MHGQDAQKQLMNRFEMRKGESFPNCHDIHHHPCAYDLCIRIPIPISRLHTVG